ncbi:paraquat-inducible protein A [Zhongshania sp. BJYM1]|jgi:paraquat-inducible protein A|uniref:paraquat-inducible protein A n=1 Tax=Zhongshania aquatica TaxID=2965069 RepID=UPI0022B436B2|nr:paraquat-inducible protein A [Marortus sp. BJYM1]
MVEPSHIPQDLTACPDCDMLIQTLPSEKHLEGHCPRCNAVLWYSAKHTDTISFAAAISGLILFYPAITLPILKLSMVGQRGSNSLIGGIYRMWLENEHSLAALIMLCSLIAPFMHLLLTAIVCFSVRINHFPAHFPLWIKYIRWMQSWSMLEVYAMGIIVAYVKMMHDGEISVSGGTYCLSALLVCVILCSQYFHEELVWQHWEKHKTA